MTLRLDVKFNDHLDPVGVFVNVLIVTDPVYEVSFTL